MIRRHRLALALADLLPGLLAALLLFTAAPALGQTSQTAGVVTPTGTITAVSTTKWYPLNGQSTCSVILTGSGTGMSITVQGASDFPPATAVTVTTIGSSGVLTANGASTGSISGFGLTGIRLNVTAFTGGTETYQLTCSPSGPGPGSTTVVAGTNGSAAVVAGTSNDGVGSNLALSSLGYNYAFNGSTWDRMRKSSFAAGPIWTYTGGTATTAIAAGTSSNTVIKASAGISVQCMVTATGTAELDLFDNATTNTGTKIGVVPANATVGTIYVWNFPAANGITAGGSASAPGVTCSYF